MVASIVVPVAVLTVSGGGSVGTKSALQSEVLQHCVLHVSTVRLAALAVIVTLLHSPIS